LAIGIVSTDTAKLHGITYFKCNYNRSIQVKSITRHHCK
jgi:hypothetical protein